MAGENNLAAMVAVRNTSIEIITFAAGVVGVTAI
jgi:hypothetical protein